MRHPLRTLGNILLYQTRSTIRDAAKLVLIHASLNSKVWMKGFLPSQWYVPVSTLLPVSKVLSFSPPQRSWFPSRIPGKLSHIRRISQGQVFSHSEGSRSRLQKKKKKSKIPETNPYPGEEHLPPNIANMHKTCYVFFSMVCARLNFFKIFIFIFSPRRSRRGTLGISSPGGPVEEPLKPFCSFFSLRRLSSSVVFQWGSLRQTLDLSKTTNEKVPWRRPSINRLK